MSVAKNVASNTSNSTIAGAGVSAKASSDAETSSANEGTASANGAAKATNGEEPKTDGGGGESNGLAEAASAEVSPPDKSGAKSDAPAPRKNSFLFGGGNPRQSPERGSGVDRRGSAGGGPSSRASSPANATGGGSGPIGGERGRKKSSEWPSVCPVPGSPFPHGTIGCLSTPAQFKVSRAALPSGVL